MTEQARDTGGLPWSNARYAKQPTHGVHVHEMDDRPCVEFVVGECALSQGAAHEEPDSVITSVRNDWPSHYGPAEAKAWIAACDRIEGSQGAAHEERGLDVERLRGAFIKAGIVWVLPAKLFDEAVTIVAREYAATPEAAPEEGTT